MIHPFLHQMARHIISKHGNDLQRIAVFFPNQTGINFFQKALSEVAESSVWAPLCSTPGRQMEKVSGLLPGNKIRLASELHRVYQLVLGREPEPFERFFPWADLLLADFDDIDKYLVDAKLLYANLAGLREINEQFSFLTEEQIALIKRFWKAYEEPSITDSKERFIRIWEKLYDVYNTFTQVLVEKGYGYEGLLHRKAAEMPETLFTGLENIEFAYVVGFNRMNSCEKTFFSELRKKYNTQFFYDTHPHVANDKMHEGGKFYRESSFFFPGTELGNEEHLSSPAIDIVSVSGSTAAIKYAASEIEASINEGQNPEDILVMMPDDRQLMPLLFSLPDNLETLNITAGLSLIETPAVSLLRVLYDVRKTASVRPSGTFFRIADVVKALRHPYLNLSTVNENRRVLDRLKSENRVRPEKQMLIENDLHRFIFSLKDERTFHESVTDILRWLLEDEDIPVFEQIVLRVACDAASSVSEVVRAEGLPTDDKAAFILLNNVFRSTRIPFEGDPVRGMQVMGPLETRNIDFRTVIIPAMADDLFPGTGASKTYIPFTLRRAFGLPLPEDRAAELSQIFFRLLQRAGRVVLICNTSAGPLTTGEPSRFILRLESDDYYRSLLRRKSMVEKVRFKEPVTIKIEKEGDVWAKMQEYVNQEEKAFYPTAINTYIDCSLRFYFRYIAGIKEEEELSDVADHAAFGSIFHTVMEWIYTDFVGKVVTPNDIENVRSQIDHYCEIAFKKHFGYKEHEQFDFEGETLIQREIIRKYVNRMLDLDAEYGPFYLTGLELGDSENPLRMPLSFSTDTGEKNVWLGGKIDRVDEKDDTVRILDYKTGADDLRYLSVPDMFNKETKTRNKAALQTWIYGIIYAHNYPEKETVQAGVISVRNMFESNFEPILQEKTDPENRMSRYEKVGNLYHKKEELMNGMRELFSEIYNKDVPFIQTDNLEKCRTCPYNDLCRR